MADPELLSLCNSPARLICRLYEHRSIFERVRQCRVGSSTAAAAGLPDIHRAVEQIAAVSHVNVRKVCNDLLEQWLPSRVARQQQESADVTMNVDDVEPEADTDGLGPVAASDDDEVDLMRAIYILERCSPSSHDDTPVYLIRFALEGSEASFTTPMCQVRAIRCLVALADLETVEKLSERTGWDRHLAGLLYTGELRRLRVMPTTDVPFDAIDKSSLARAVCRSRDPNAGTVAACLAVDFGLDDEQIWTSVFGRLVVSSIPVMRHARPWRGRQVGASLSSFVTKSLAGESMDSSAAFDILSVIQKIPGPIDSTLLFNWAVKFFTFHLPGCSVACGLMSPGDCSEKVNALLSSNKDAVIAEIDKCTKQGQIFALANVICKKIAELEVSSVLSESNISACSEDDN